LHISGGTIEEVDILSGIIKYQQYYLLDLSTSEESMKFARVAVAILSALSLASPTSAFTTPAYHRTQITATAGNNANRSYYTYLKESKVEEESTEVAAVDDETPQQPQQQKEQEPTAAPATAAATIPTTKRTSTTTSKITAERIEKVTKERPYPLFLAEKAASILPSFTKDDYYPTNNQPKERIIVLGTGWGAASFLKTIDCNKYDVTVISPRNYFVFTPMLAGASVGTVEFRSITEPVREVSMR
jgi:hypothetical protein